MKYIDFCTYVHGTKQEETTGGRCLHPAAYQLLAEVMRGGGGRNEPAAWREAAGRKDRTGAQT